MPQLVIIRHGQSEFNAKKIFTGWLDPDLTQKGEEEALKAGEILQKHGYNFDIAYTSVLSRAIRTLDLALYSGKMLYVPVIKDYRLNERCYGALQGHTHAEKIEELGEEQVFIYRRSFDTPPPALKKDDKRHPINDIRFKNVPNVYLPDAESLKDTVKRVEPYMQSEILPAVASGKQVLISAHGNSIRAMVMMLEGITPEAIREVNIPTGVPMVIEFDENMQFISRKYLEN